MARYRKKPIEIDAFCVYQEPFPAWFMDAAQVHSVNPALRTVTIETLEGTMTAQVGDYIIKGVEGELYLCKPWIFAKTYDKVEEDIHA